MNARRPKKRRRFQPTTKTKRICVTLPITDHEWLEKRADPRYGASDVARDAILLYQVVLKTIAPRRKTTDPIDKTITTVRAALVAYLAQQRADQPGAAVAPTPTTDSAPVEGAESRESEVALTD